MKNKDVSPAPIPPLFGIIHEDGTPCRAFSRTVNSRNAAEWRLSPAASLTLALRCHYADHRVVEYIEKPASFTRYRVKMSRGNLVVQAESEIPGTWTTVMALPADSGVVEFQAPIRDISEFGNWERLQKKGP